jgi:S-adenosylmethionine:tRNA ribosyltransferase-isomerase
MRRAQFHYELPAELIAQFPPRERGDSRLLVLDADTGALQDLSFIDLPGLLAPGDLLVFNDTQTNRGQGGGADRAGGG